MKTLTFNREGAREALLPLLSLVAVGCALTLGGVAVTQPKGIGLLATVLAATAVATSLARAQPGQLALFYFVYLMFEGTVKILSNYNSVARVGSDILLSLVFLRLLSRNQREGNPDLTPETRRRFGTLVGFFTLFWLWVAVQFFNPWGLGILPSIAGLKIYLVPLLVFFAAGLFMRDSELRLVPPALLALGIVQGIVSVVDWYLGPAGLPTLHPLYAQKFKEFLQGLPYRPFGTTQLPGAPAVWIFHCLTGGVLCLFQWRGRKDFFAKAGRIAFFLFLPLAAGTLIACQVRMGLLRFLAMLMVGLVCLGKRSGLMGVVLATGFLMAIFRFSSVDFQQAIEKKTYVEVGDRFNVAVARLATLRNRKDWAEARGGSWAVDEFFRRADATTLGVGLSRIGASSAPWTNRIDEDRFFGRDWSFTDNVVLALFTELGIGGLVAYIALALGTLAALYRRSTGEAHIALGACFLVLLSGWGSEGILFQPDASMFWLIAAYGVRSPHEEVVT